MCTRMARSQEKQHKLTLDVEEDCGQKAGWARAYVCWCQESHNAANREIDPTRAF